jgi:hypothetical protein
VGYRRLSEAEIAVNRRKSREERGVTEDFGGGRNLCTEVGETSRTAPGIGLAAESEYITVI